MFAQCKAVEAVKAKQYFNKDRKKHYLKECVLAKQRDCMVTIETFYESQPELKAAMKSSNWYKAARKDAGIQEAYQLLAWRKRKAMVVPPVDVPPPVPVKPSPPGHYLRQDGDHCIFSCGCRLHMQLLKSPPTVDSACWNCNHNVNIWTLEKSATYSLLKLMEQGTRQKKLEP
jgi:hypothetical protein